MLVKHALPTLDAAVPAREWQLGTEGEVQAHRLATRLRSFLPFELAASPELKARRTAELIGSELGVSFATVAGLEEFDRPALPLLSVGDHAALNAKIFSDLSRVVIGRESGALALQRFRTALSALVEPATTRDPLVVITHGTVISLLVSAHNDVDGFQLWRELSCASFVVLSYPGFRLVSGVERLG